MASVTAPSPESQSPPPLSDSKQSSSPSSSPSKNSTSPPPTKSPPPSSPPPSSPPPASPPPPTAKSPPPKPSPSPPPPEKTKSPPPTTSPSPPAPNGSPPHSPPPPPSLVLSPPPPTTVASPPPPSTTNFTNPGSPSLALPPPPSLVPIPPSSNSVPPPPHTSSKSPPSSSSHHHSPTSSSPPPSSSSSSSYTGIIVGAAVGGGIVVLAMIIICLVCFLKKKNKKQYYMDPIPPRGPQGEYYNGLTNWNSPQPGEHIVKLPPPPGLMGTPPGGVGGWAGPPPPAPVLTSSEYSSGYLDPSHHTPIPPQSPLGLNQSTFSYDELAAATGSFSEANVLGQGGFGYVHKGVLANGKEVAVKSLKTGSGQGEREFQAEVEIISRVHHRHLVSLVGYCIADGQRMLVYEFVSNKTLEHHLHGKGQPTMDWATRLRIALGSAKGLAYLHEDCHPRIIHRDIKAANILLDDKFEAMVADFGLAKLSSDNFTHVSTRVMGTFGYLAPEYASSGKLTDKSDVFSFGVMLLELITGRRPVDPTNKFMEDSLVDWARPLLTHALEDGNYDELVDPRLENNYEPQEMARMVACAAASIRHSARRRSKMSQIVRALEGDSSLDDLNDLGKQAGQSSAYSPSTGSDTQTYDTGAYNADMVKFKQMVMSGQDFPSSEYGATSEYGLNPSSSSGDSRELGNSANQKRQNL
ncbi:unnamed protein product [Camellia sinensis]